MAAETQILIAGWRGNDPILHVQDPLRLVTDLPGYVQIKAGDFNPAEPVRIMSHSMDGGLNKIRLKGNPLMRLRNPKFVGGKLIRVGTADGSVQQGSEEDEIDPTVYTEEDSEEDSSKVVTIIKWVAGIGFIILIVAAGIKLIKSAS